MFEKICSKALGRNEFFLVLVLTLGIKIWLGMSLPISGDEALFYWWGRFPNLGYYDHPPMVGWLLAGMTPLSEQPLWLRLPAIATSPLIAIGIVDLINRILPKSDIAWSVGIFYLLIPISWIGVLITNDTPLMLFTFASGYCFLRGFVPAESEHRLSAKDHPATVWMIGCGFFLGLAFLSKYLAVIQGLAYMAALLLPRAFGGIGRGQVFRPIMLIGLAAAPMVALNIGYNVTNCWNNVMFNLFNRHEDASLSPANSLLYLLMMVYLITPWALWSLFKSGWGKLNQNGLLAIAMIPLVFFLGISIFKRIGLHWPLAFLPFFVLLFASQTKIKMALLSFFMAVFSIVHLLALVTVLYAPPSFARQFSTLQGLDFLRNAKAVFSAVRANTPEDTVLAAESYSSAAILGYHGKRYVPVFGVGSRYGRLDDTLVNFQDFDGKNIRIISRKNRDPMELAPFFESVTASELSFGENSYLIIDGNKFKFSEYREIILTEITNRYYQIPGALPVLSCKFLSRYELWEQSQASLQ
ncbi:MAG: hypothetical protein EB101_06395 [Chitinophagia bacterium]|nr:hypothetical protein [Chitinophagia bacterium]